MFCRGFFVCFCFCRKPCVNFLPFKKNLILILVVVLVQFPECLAFFECYYCAESLLTSPQIYKLLTILTEKNVCDFSVQLYITMPLTSFTNKLKQKLSVFLCCWNLSIRKNGVKFDEDGSQNCIENSEGSISAPFESQVTVTLSSG